MPDQKQGGWTISLLSVTLIVLLTLVSVLSAVAIVEHYHARRNAMGSDAFQKASKTERISLEAQYEVAIHESGHAVLGQLFIPDRPILKVWLYTEKPDDADYLGMTEPGDAVASYPPEVWDRSIVIFFLGGLAAEQVFFGRRPPDEYEDKDVAGEETLDYCERVGCECPTASKVGEQCLLKDMMRAERERLYVETVGCLEANKETVVILANLLFRKAAEDVKPVSAPERGAGGRRRSLEAEELGAFFATHPLAACPK